MTQERLAPPDYRQVNDESTPCPKCQSRKHYTNGDSIIRCSWCEEIIDDVRYDRIPQCFGCWEQLTEQQGLLISPPQETSSDNVNSVQTFNICKKCFKGILELIMGEESCDYKKGMPTLKKFIEEFQVIQKQGSVKNGY